MKIFFEKINEVFFDGQLLILTCLLFYIHLKVNQKLIKSALLKFQKIYFHFSGFKTCLKRVTLKTYEKSPKISKIYLHKLGLT